MQVFCYDLEENITEEELKNIVADIFPKNKYILFMISDAYIDFKEELLNGSVSLFENDEVVVDYLKDDELTLLYEFFERGGSLPFVITTEKTDLRFENVAPYDFDAFYDLFEDNNVAHIKLGPDRESLIYSKKNENHYE